MSDASGTLPDTPDGPDLDAIRADIDELKEQSTEELVSPTPAKLAEREPEPEPTEAIGSVDWQEPEKTEDGQG